MSEGTPYMLYIDESKNKAVFELFDGQRIILPFDFAEILTELGLARDFIAAFGSRKRGDELDWPAILKASDKYDHFKKSLAGEK